MLLFFDNGDELGVLELWKEFSCYKIGEFLNFEDYKPDIFYYGEELGGFIPFIVCDGK